MKNLLIVLTLIMMGSLAACSSEDENGVHAWQEQTDAIKKAEDVNKLIMDTHQKQREAIEEQSQ